MTWRLIAGQMRAHRGYFAWTATLLTVLVAILTYTVVAGTTQAVLFRQVETIRGQGLENVGYAMVSPTPVENEQGERTITPAELRGVIDGTPGATATSNVWYLTAARDGDYDPYFDVGFNAIASYGAAEHQGLLSAGRLPVQRGEVALAADVANELGVALGERATLYREHAGPDGFAIDRPDTFTVVGITASRDLAGYDVDLPGAFLSWDETHPGGVLRRETLLQEGVTAEVAFVTLNWEGSGPLLDPFLEYSGSSWSGSIQLPQATGVWLVVTGVLILAMVVMSFSVGRSQAAARTRWIATVRTMGATRGYIAAATVLETLAIAGLAALAGTAVGVTAAQAQLALARAASEGPFGPSLITVHWATLLVVALVALAVALLIAAVPAFWASRVDPVAALKPVNDITETELSRRVSPHWLWIPLVAGVGLIFLGGWRPNTSLEGFSVLGVIISSLALLALTIEVVRLLIPRMGRRLSKSRNASRMTAGDALRTQPKQAVSPALLTAVTLGLISWWVMTTATDPHSVLRVRGYSDFGYSRAAAIEWWWQQFASTTAVTAVVLTALAIQLVAASIFVAHRTATAREGATRRALGLSESGIARAHWWQQWAPQVVGAVVGVVFGFAIAEAWRFVNAVAGYPSYESMPTTLWAIAIVAVLATAAIMLLTGAVTAWTVSRVGSRSTPLGQALRAP